MNYEIILAIVFVTFHEDSEVYLYSLENLFDVKARLTWWHSMFLAGYFFIIFSSFQEMLLLLPLLLFLQVILFLFLPVRACLVIVAFLCQRQAQFSLLKKIFSKSKKLCGIIIYFFWNVKIKRNTRKIFLKWIF